MPQGQEPTPAAAPTALAQRSARGARGKSAAWVLAAAAVVAGGAYFYFGRISGDRQSGVAGQQQQAAQPAKGKAEAPVLVALATVVRQDVPIVLQLSGTVVSLNSVEVRPQVSNMVQAVHVKEGQFVRAGQLLFTLDDRADRANLQKAQAQLQKDQASQTDLQRQVKRSQELVAENFIAKSALDTTLSQLDGQKAAVAADQAAIRAAQVAVDLAILRAPVAGRIGAVAVYPGSLVTPAAGVVTVTQLDPIAVSFPVPEEHLQDLLAAVKKRLPVVARVAGRGESVTGKLDFVDNTVDPQVGTVRAKAVFANPTQALWPGQFVETRVTVRNLPDVAVVPAASLLTLADGNAVFVVDDQLKVTQRKVHTLHTFGTQVAVSGVEPGDKVAVEGKQNLRTGSVVRVEAQKKPGAAGQAPAADGPGAPAATGARAPA